MQDPNSFPPFQPERENSLAEELYPDIFADAFPPIAPGPLTYDELKATGKMPRPMNTTGTRKRAAQIAPGSLTYNELEATGKLPRPTSTTRPQAVRTERSTDRVRAMPDDPSQLSLVDALQATISRKKPKKNQLVISGEKRRQRNTDSAYQLYQPRSEPTWQITPRLRLVIILVVIVLILLVVLLFPIALSMR